MNTETANADRESAALPDPLRERIDSIIGSDKVVLFMKGARSAPQCGFSSQVVQILDRILLDYTTVDVLADPELREGIKEYSDWPTIPQLYIENEFQGGCDIVREMYASGDLHRALGAERPDPEAVAIEVTEEARELIEGARSHYGGGELHLGVDVRFRTSLGFGPVSGQEVEVEADGLRIYLDPDSATRAGGIVISAVETPQGRSLDIQNPNQPGVQLMTPAELERRRRESAPLRLIDVRGEEERAKAHIDGSERLDAQLERRLLELPKDTVMVFYGHRGGRAQAAAQSFAVRGFTEVHSLAGGIDAWSEQVDSSVPRY